MIIAGMHRSGTSLVTQWLSRCGLNVGDTLLGKGIGNEDGHYEDLEFYSFHVNLLRSRNLPDSGFLESKFLGMTLPERSAISKLIDQKTMLHNEWGWKDPRTCLFLPDYHRLLPEAVYLVVYRTFQQTVGSLLVRTQKVIESKIDKDTKRGFFSRLWHKRTKRREMEDLCKQYASPFLKVWILYNQSILSFMETIAEEKHIVLSYTSLIESDENVFDHLTNTWQFSLTHTPFLSVYKPALISKEIDINRYVDKSLLEEAMEIEARLLEKVFKNQESRVNYEQFVIN